MALDLEVANKKKKNIDKFGNEKLEGFNYGDDDDGDHV